MIPVGGMRFVLGYLLLNPATGSTQQITPLISSDKISTFVHQTETLLGSLLKYSLRTINENLPSGIQETIHSVSTLAYSTIASRFPKSASLRNLKEWIYDYYQNVDQTVMKSMSPRIAIFEELYPAAAGLIGDSLVDLLLLVVWLIFVVRWIWTMISWIWKLIHIGSKQPPRSMTVSFPAMHEKPSDTPSSVSSPATPSRNNPPRTSRKRIVIKK